MTVKHKILPLVLAAVLLAAMAGCKPKMSKVSETDEYTTYRINQAESQAYTYETFTRDGIVEEFNRLLAETERDTYVMDSEAEHQHFYRLEGDVQRGLQYLEIMDDAGKQIMLLSLSADILRRDKGDDVVTDHVQSLVRSICPEHWELICQTLSKRDSKDMVSCNIGGLSFSNYQDSIIGVLIRMPSA